MYALDRSPLGDPECATTAMASVDPGFAKAFITSPEQDRPRVARSLGEKAFARLGLGVPLGGDCVGDRFEGRKVKFADRPMTHLAQAAG